MNEETAQALVATCAELATNLSEERAAPLTAALLDALLDGATAQASARRDNFFAAGVALWCVAHCAFCVCAFAHKCAHQRAVNGALAGHVRGSTGARVAHPVSVDAVRDSRLVVTPLLTTSTHSMAPAAASEATCDFVAAMAIAAGAASVPLLPPLVQEMVSLLHRWCVRVVAVVIMVMADASQRVGARRGRAARICYCSGGLRTAAASAWRRVQ